MKRDFTYIDDVIEGIIRSITGKPIGILQKDNYNSDANYSIYNIGNNNPQVLEHFISLLEKHIGEKAILNYLQMQKGDVFFTWTKIKKLNYKSPNNQMPQWQMTNNYKLRVINHQITQWLIWMLDWLNACPAFDGIEWNNYQLPTANCLTSECKLYLGY